MSATSLWLVRGRALINWSLVIDPQYHLVDFDGDDLASESPCTGHTIAPPARVRPREVFVYFHDGANVRTRPTRSR
jgi:hypothetical protein